MNSDRNDCPRISRRVALTGTALALGGAAATVISQATAQEKLSRSTITQPPVPGDSLSCS